MNHCTSIKYPCIIRKCCKINFNNINTLSGGRTSILFLLFQVLLAIPRPMSFHAAVETNIIRGGASLFILFFGLSCLPRSPTFGMFLSLGWMLSLLTLLDCHHMTRSLPKTRLYRLKHPIQLSQRFLQTIHVIVQDEWFKASRQGL